MCTRCEKPMQKTGFHCDGCDRRYHWNCIRFQGCICVVARGGAA